MDKKHIKQELTDRLSMSAGLEDLGSQDELLGYLKEEFRELELSNRWQEIEDLLNDDSEDTLDNPHNILAYYLCNTHKKPQTLLHRFTGGDYPDVDLDFEPEARGRIKEYLRDRFGERNCMDVATFQGIKAKGAIQSLARVEGIDPQEVYPITTSIKYNVNNNEENTLEYILDHNAKVREWLRQYPNVETNIEKMKNVYSGYSTHASAFIIADRPIDDYIPVILNKDKTALITGYTESSHIDALNKVGLIKFDILGLKNLTVNRETEDMIRDRHGVEIIWDKVPVDDPKVYKLLRKGLTGGVFQIDSGVASGVLATIQPDCFEDLSAVNALIRPACLHVGSHVAYKNHKVGKFDRTEFPVWKDLKGKVSDFTYDILDATYGIPIYQEQTMALLAEFCEVPLDETNTMRKIIGKPDSKLKPADREYIKEQQDIFISNAKKRIGEELAWQWWEKAVGSLSYGFNRSHAMAYAMVAFRQLWLKRYYPKEFYCALLRMEQASASANKKSPLMRFIIEARQLGVPVRPPDINKSKRQLDYNGGTIYMGFEQVKGVGDAAVNHIVERAPYQSFEDFTEKHKKGTGSKVTKATIEALIYSDAFADWGNRVELLEKWHNIYNKGEKFIAPSKFELYKREKDCLSTVLSTDEPMEPIFGYLSITEATETPHNRKLKLQGIVDKIEKLTSKKGARYIKLQVNDLENSCTILVFRGFGDFSSKNEDGVRVGDIIQAEVTHKDGDTMFLSRLIKVRKGE